MLQIVMYNKLKGLQVLLQLLTIQLMILQISLQAQHRVTPMLWWIAVYSRTSWAELDIR